MNNLFTSKGRVILLLLLVFQFGLKLQASAHTRMVCDTDTIKKSAINSQTITTDTTLVLKAGSTISTIVKNSDTTLIIDGVATTVPKKSDVKADPATSTGADSLNAAKKDTANKSHGLVEVKNNDPSTIAITAPPADGVVQVKNTENAPPANVTIGSVPTDGIIQVKDAATMSADSAAQAKAKDATDSGQPQNGQTQTDSTKAQKANSGAAGSPDAATDAATTAAGTAAAGTTPGATSTSGQPINGMIQVKNVDTTLAKKEDTTLMRRPDTTAMQTDSADSTAVKAKGYYLEVGGAGLAISANYDARFNKERNGWGYRVGVGGFISGGNRVFTIPFQVNYLIGQHSSMIELGAGTTFLSSTGDSKGKTWAFDKITGFIATGSIGYRYQPEHRGINFRLAFVPILYDEGLIPAGGISVGYTFK